MMQVGRSEEVRDLHMPSAGQILSAFDKNELTSGLLLRDDEGAAACVSSLPV